MSRLSLRTDDESIQESIDASLSLAQQILTNPPVSRPASELDVEALPASAPMEAQAQTPAPDEQAPVADGESDDDESGNFAELVMQLKKLSAGGQERVRHLSVSLDKR